MARYRKKPVATEAFQWFSKDGAGGRVRSLGQNRNHEEYFGLLLPVGGQIILNDGDWVVEGEDYPVKPDEFEKTYEPVPEHEHV